MGVGVDRVEITPSVEREWDTLGDRARAMPWIRPRWVVAWWRAFGAGRLEVLAARRKGKLVGVLPLFRRFEIVRSPTNWHTPAFGLLVEDDSARHALTRALFRRGASAVDLSFLARSGHDFEDLRTAAESARFRVHVRTIARSPYLTIDRPWAEYEKTLSRSLRGDVRRQRRRLAERGEVGIEISGAYETLADRLEEGYRVEAAGWKGQRGTAIASTPATRRFYTEVAHWAAERGWLRLAFLRVDGHATAFQLNLEVDGTFYYVKGGYDPSFQRFSPGKVLLHATLKHAFSSGLGRYEFLGGDDPYKLEWTSEVGDLDRFQAFAPSAVGLAAWATYRYARPLTRRVLTRIAS